MENINIVNRHLKFPQVVLKEPLENGFVLIAAEVDRKTSLFSESKKKKALIAAAKLLGKELESGKEILEFSIFKAALFPPGRDGEYLQKEKKNRTIHSRYDVVILLKLATPGMVAELERSTIYKQLLEEVAGASTFHFVFNAANLRRIDNVNHQKNGIFLFNFFIAESKEKNLAIWEYTAGWFQDQTGLDNSTLFHSVDGAGTYSVINHCRWDSLWDVLPSLIFKKTFRTYVLDNFAANNVAAIPVLYRLA